MLELLARGRECGVETLAQLGHRLVKGRETKIVRLLRTALSCQFNMALLI